MTAGLRGLELRLPLSKFFGLIGLLMLPAAAQAALPAAQLLGTVVDENGVAAAGVEVVVRAPNGQRQATYTDVAGHFAFRALSVGSYSVSLNKPGFFRLAHQAVQLHEGVNELSFTLSHEFEIHEKVEVVSSAQGIEPQESAHQEILVAHEIRDIPVPSTHDLKNSLPAMPGVVQDPSGKLHVAGGRVGETQFLLDGFEIGDPATGDITFRVNVDTVRAVEVESGRYSAAYPHAGAGVLALDTTAGDDRWRFGTTNFVPGLRVERGAHLGNWYPRFTFSGPLRKGRAWFSEATSLQHTFALISQQPPGADTITQWAGDNLLRLQLNLTPTHVLQGSFLYNQSSASHLGLGPFAPLSTTTHLAARRYFVSLKDQIWWKNMLLEVGAAADTGHSESQPRGSDTYVITPSGTSGNFFEGLRLRARRWQFLGNLTMPSRRWHGSHDFAVGVNLDAIDFSHLALRHTIEVERSDTTLSRRTTFSGPSQFHLSNTQIGGYAQDFWRPLRSLLLQFGIRSDGDQIIHRALVEPRIAANILPFRDDRAKLALAWGIYYQPVELAVLGQGLDQQQTDVFFDNSGKSPVSLASSFVLPTGGLKQPRFYTTSVEWIQKFGANSLASVHFSRRIERFGLAYEKLQPAQPGGLFLLQNNRHDRYRSVEFSLRHSFGRKAELFGSFTRSRASSNEVHDYSLGELILSPQASGRVSWDAPNRFLSWGWAPAPIWGLLISYFFEYRTGFPFSVINQQQQLVGPPNRLRFPDYLSLNLGIEKRFRFRGYEWAARLAAVNVTGHANSNAVINNVDAPNFLRFAGGQGRAVTARLRLVGRK